MQSRSGRSQKIRHSYMKIYGLTGALCVVVALVIAITSTQIGLIGGKTTPTGTSLPTPTPSVSEGSPTPTPETPSAPTESQTPTESEPGPAILRIPVTEADLVAANPLLIVNSDHPFDPSKAKDLVNMYNVADKTNSQNRLKFLGINALLNREAFEALQQLQFTVGSTNEGYCFLIYHSHSSSLSDKEKVDCYCSDSELTDPSHTAHATGYVVDLRYDKGGAGYQVYDVKNTATKTLLENCAKFGWIQSFSAANLASNGKVESDQRNFRYVGVPHALYIMENGLTFDSYMAALKETGFMKPLQITDSDTKTVYKVYFVSAEDALNPAKGIPVPTDSDYKIQGNGVDGFIVTLTEKTAE